VVVGREGHPYQVTLVGHGHYKGAYPDLAGLLGAPDEYGETPDAYLFLIEELVHQQVLVPVADLGHAQAHQAVTLHGVDVSPLVHREEVEASGLKEALVI
jgi:hypothetical protein